jgi:CxxC motif-containing protein (DUF1111 family)
MRRIATAVVTVAALLWIGALGLAQRAGVTFPAAATAPPSGPPRPGDPLPGLTAREFSEFRLGLADFLEVETAAEGLGPAFNATSCAVCHNVPAIGGMSAVLESRIGRRNSEGAFQPVDATGETLVHLFSIPTHGCQPAIPPVATIIARRQPIPLFGSGLVELIPDADLIALEDPQDRDGDGVSGRAARLQLSTGEIRVGRFGWKAQHVSLLTFGADAYRNEMGITNDLFPREFAFGISADAMRRCDRARDPEDRRDRRTGRRGIDNFASFMRLLAPIERGDFGPDVGMGQQVFETIGCATCHVPVHQTGPNSNRLYDRRAVPAFSDFLLHDVGTGDGIAQAAATENEIRTPALWGLRLRRPLMHDGRAVSLEDAILAHGQEAAPARTRFLQLDPSLRQALLSFLSSL